MCPGNKWRVRIPPQREADAGILPSSCVVDSARRRSVHRTDFQLPDHTLMNVLGHDSNLTI